MASNPNASSQFAPTWSLVDLPAGKHETPDWCAGMHINWLDGYVNSPEIRLKVRCDIAEWQGQVWERKGDLFFTQHADGRAKFLSHSGGIRPIKMQRTVVRGAIVNRQWVPPVVEDYEVLATSQQEGFAGRHFLITMGGSDPLAGQDVLLRGPWYGASLPGYVPVVYVDMSDPDCRRKSEPWYRRTGLFGVSLAEDTFIRVFARFAPHLRLARVSNRYGTRLEPMKPEWDAPKHWMQAAARRVA